MGASCNSKNAPSPSKGQNTEAAESKPLIPTPSTPKPDGSAFFVPFYSTPLGICIEPADGRNGAIVSRVEDPSLVVVKPGHRIIGILSLGESRHEISCENTPYDQILESLKSTATPFLVQFKAIPPRWEQNGEHDSHREEQLLTSTLTLNSPPIAGDPPVSKFTFSTSPCPPTADPPPPNELRSNVPEKAHSDGSVGFGPSRLSSKPPDGKAHSAPDQSRTGDPARHLLGPSQPAATEPVYKDSARHGSPAASSQTSSTGGSTSSKKRKKRRHMHHHKRFTIERAQIVRSMKGFQENVLKKLWNKFDTERNNYLRPSQVKKILAVSVCYCAKFLKLEPQPTEGQNVEASTVLFGQLRHYLDREKNAPVSRDEFLLFVRPRPAPKIRDLTVDDIGEFFQQDLTDDFKRKVWDKLQEDTQGQPAMLHSGQLRLLFLRLIDMYYRHKYMVESPPETASDRLVVKCIAKTIQVGLLDAKEHTLTFSHYFWLGKALCHHPEQDKRSDSQSQSSKKAKSSYSNRTKGYSRNESRKESRNESRYKTAGQPSHRAAFIPEPESEWTANQSSSEYPKQTTDWTETDWQECAMSLPEGCTFKKVAEFLRTLSRSSLGRIWERFDVKKRNKLKIEKVQSLFHTIVGIMLRQRYPSVPIPSIDATHQLVDMFLSALQIRQDLIGEDHLTFESFADLGDWLHREFITDYAFNLERLGNFFGSLSPMDKDALWERVEPTGRGTISVELVEPLLRELIKDSPVAEFLDKPKHREKFLEKLLTKYKSKFPSLLTKASFEQFGVIALNEAQRVRRDRFANDDGSWEEYGYTPAGPPSPEHTSGAPQQQQYHHTTPSGHANRGVRSGVPPLHSGPSATTRGHGVGPPLAQTSDPANTTSPLQAPGGERPTLQDLYVWLKEHAVQLDQFWGHWFQAKETLSRSDFEEFMFLIFGQITRETQLDRLREDRDYTVLVRDICRIVEAQDVRTEQAFFKKHEFPLLHMWLPAASSNPPHGLHAIPPNNGMNSVVTKPHNNEISELESGRHTVYSEAVITGLAHEFPCHQLAAEIRKLSPAHRDRLYRDTQGHGPRLIQELIHLAGPRVTRVSPEATGQLSRLIFDERIAPRLSSRGDYISNQDFSFLGTWLAIGANAPLPSQPPKPVNAAPPPPQPSTPPPVDPHPAYHLSFNESSPAPVVPAHHQHKRIDVSQGPPAAPEPAAAVHNPAPPPIRAAVPRRQLQPSRLQRQAENHLAQGRHGGYNIAEIAKVNAERDAVNREARANHRAQLAREQAARQKKAREAAARVHRATQNRWAANAAQAASGPNAEASASLPAHMVDATGAPAQVKPVQAAVQHQAAPVQAPLERVSHDLPLEHHRNPAPPQPPQQPDAAAAAAQPILNEHHQDANTLASNSRGHPFSNMIRTGERSPASTDRRASGSDPPSQHSGSNHNEPQALPAALALAPMNGQQQQRSAAPVQGDALSTAVSPSNGDGPLRTPARVNHANAEGEQPGRPLLNSARPDATTQPYNGKGAAATNATPAHATNKPASSARNFGVTAGDFDNLGAWVTENDASIQNVLKRIPDRESEYEIEQLLHLCLNLYSRNAPQAPQYLGSFDGPGPTKQLVERACRHVNGVFPKGTIDFENIRVFGRVLCDFARIEASGAQTSRSRSG